MARRTPRLEATQEKTLTPLKERCEQCGQLLWVAYHGHRTVTTLSGLWKLTLVVQKSYRAELSALSSALSTGRRRALGAAAWRIRPWRVIALIGQWRFREHRSVPEMHQALLARGISVAQRSVTYLMQRDARTGDLTHHGSGADQGTVTEARTRDPGH